MVGNTKENGGLTYNVYSYPENEKSYWYERKAESQCNFGQGG